MLKLSLRDLRAHVGRYVLTFIAVVIGVAFVGGVLVLTDTLTRTFDDMVSDFAEGTDAQVRGSAEFDIGAEFGGGTARPRIDSSLTDKVAEVEGVRAVDPFVQGFIRPIDDEGEPFGSDFGPPTLGSSWPVAQEANPWDLTEGSRAPEGSDEVVVDKRTAEKLGWELGDTARFQGQLGTGEATVVGIARFGTADSPLGASFLMFDIAAAEELFAEPGRIDGITVVGEPGISQVALRDTVADVLQDDNVEVVTGDTVRDETQDQFAEQFSIFSRILLVFALLAVFVGAFVIYTSFSFIVAQRERQIALIRAVGASRGQVLGSVVIEALIIGILASAVGYALGIGLAWLLSTLMMQGDASLAITVIAPIAAFLVGIGVTVSSAFVPARRAAKTPPVAAMRRAAIDTSHRSLPRLIIGAACLVPGALLVFGVVDDSMAARGLGIVLVFISLVIFGPLAVRPATAVIGAPLGPMRGVVGKFAQQNAARNPRRTAATGSMLMICMGAVTLTLVVLASMRASIDKAVDERFFGDLVLDSGLGFGGPGFPPEAEEDVNALDEVDVAAGVRLGFAEVDGSAEALSGVNPARAFDLYDVGITEGDIEDMDETGMAVWAERAEREGWRVGDEVEVTFAETGTKTFSIAALVDTKDLLGEYVLSNEAFDVNVPTAGDMQILVRLNDDASLGEGRAALEPIMDQYPAGKVQSLQEFKDDTKAQFDFLLVGVGVLLALTIVVAIVGIVNTTILSVVERTREIGLTRAVGALRGQIRSTIRWEALVIAGFGVFAALGTGIGFGYVIVRSLKDDGFTEFALPIGELIAVTFVTAILTLLAALFPAAWAGRRPILSAIATE